MSSYEHQQSSPESCNTPEETKRKSPKSSKGERTSNTKRSPLAIMRIDGISTILSNESLNIINKVPTVLNEKTQQINDLQAQILEVSILD